VVPYGEVALRTRELKIFIFFVVRAVQQPVHSLRYAASAPPYVMNVVSHFVITNMASPIQYLKLDFESHRDALKQRVAARWPTRWNDFLTSSFGMVLIDLIAWSTTMLAFAVNAVASELYIPTMRLRESAARLGALTGYKMRGATASTLHASARLSTPLAYAVTIRKGAVTRAQNVSQTVFEVARDYTILAGALSPETLVCTFDASLAGDLATDVRTNVRVINGYGYVDLVDTSIDASQLVTVGQQFYVTGDPTRYTITGTSAATGAISNNRILLDRAWEGASDVTTAAVVDNTIELTQGQTITETVVTPEEDAVAGWFFAIPRSNLISGSVTVKFADTAWLEVDSLSTQDSDAEVFEVVPEVNGNYTVRFGDNVFGAAVPAEAAVVITYRVGGGVSGNIGPNQLRSNVTGFASYPYSSVTVTITNEFTAAYGGRDVETLEEARVSIPRHTRTGGQCVTLSDYETTATGYAGIAVAKASARRTASVLEGNLVTVYAWTTATGGGLTTISSAQRAGLQAHLQSRAVATDYVMVENGVARPMPVAAKFAALRSTDPVTTRLVLEDIVASYARGLSPGDPVVYSDLLRLMDEAPEVDSVLLSVPSGDLQPRSENEVFSTPLRNYYAAVSLTGLSGNGYEGKLPHYPLAAWAAKARINSVPVTIIPDTEEGYARIISSKVSTVYEGASSDRPSAGSRYAGAYYQTTDSGEVYRCVSSGGSYSWALQTATQVKSRINLRNGDVFLHSTGVVSSFEISLIPVQGYTSVRYVDVYVGYTGSAGENIATRTRIRDAIVGAVEQTAPGASLFSERSAQVSISAFNLKNVVEHVTGVRSCERVALDSATGTGARIDANDYQQIKIRNILINGFGN